MVGFQILYNYNFSEAIIISPEEIHICRQVFEVFYNSSGVEQ